MVDRIMDEPIGPGAPDTAKGVPISRLLEALLALPEGERRGWIDECCGTNASLRAELESLAAASAGRASFPERPSQDTETATMPITEIPGLPASGPTFGRTIGHYRLLAKL